MASYLPLFNCIVLFVLFGSTLCAGGEDNTSSSSEHWMKGIKLCNVTLTSHFIDYTRPGGFIRSEIYKHNPTWGWYFYGPGRWNPESGDVIKGGDWSFNFMPSEICGIDRDVNKVDFWMKADDDRIPPRKYTLVFADEKDARRWTGEDVGK